MNHSCLTIARFYHLPYLGSFLNVFIMLPIKRESPHQALECARHSLCPQIILWGRTYIFPLFKVSKLKKWMVRWFSQWFRGSGWEDSTCIQVPEADQWLEGYISKYPRFLILTLNQLNFTNQIPWVYSAVYMFQRNTSLRNHTNKEENKIHWLWYKNVQVKQH